MIAGAAERRILLLTQDDCSLCDQAKDVLQRVAFDIPIDVEEVGLDTERGVDLARQAGLLFAPGIFVNDAFLSHGRLSEKKLRKALVEPPRR